MKKIITLLFLLAGLNSFAQTNLTTMVGAFQSRDTTGGKKVVFRYNTGDFLSILTNSDMVNTLENSVPFRLTLGNLNKTGNMGIGISSLKSITTPSSSVFLGNGDDTDVISSGFQGTYNTAVGLNALAANQFGSDNTAIGANALQANTTGFYNFGGGHLALENNTSGWKNNIIGSFAARYNTTGSSNTGIGHENLLSNTIGNYNSVIGSRSLYYNSIGNSNTAIGYFSGYFSKGNNNTFIGANAGSELQDGSGNVVIGRNVQLLKTVINNNIAIGNGAGQLKLINNGTNWSSPDTIKAPYFQGNFIGIGNAAYLSASETTSAGTIVKRNSLGDINARDIISSRDLSTNNTVDGGTTITGIFGFGADGNILRKFSNSAFYANGQSASSTLKGFVSTSAQNFAGAKTFDSTVQSTNFGACTVPNAASYYSSAVNTSSIGQLLLPPSAVNYTGTNIGTLWNNSGSLKIRDIDSIKTIAYTDSPVFTGTPTAPTATAGTNTTQIATTAFVMNATTIREVTDEFMAIEGQITFTGPTGLSQVPSPNSKVKMYVNGKRISNTAYTISGSTVTYIPANNDSYFLNLNDRIQFDYYY
jgi:hypothetical protein